MTEPTFNLNPPTAASQPKLLDQVKAKCRVLHYSPRTEEAYVHWIRRFILFHHKRHPREMGALEMEAFLSSLAVRERVAASTQNQALSALLFFLVSDNWNSRFFQDRSYAQLAARPSRLCAFA